MGEPNSVLVVGAGAVGQVCARHLQQGGARVSFFVREKYRASVAAGLTLYPLNRRPLEAQRLAAAVLTRADEVAAQRFDQVWLTMASTALSGPWLSELLSASRAATVVTLQPNPEDRAVLLAAGASPERLVMGMIGFLSYAAPLPGETRFPAPGMAYWFPPLSPSQFSGPAAHVAAVVSALRRGGFPARPHADLGKTAYFATTVLLSYVVALQTAGWSFAAVLGSPLLGRASAAAREAFEVLERTHGPTPLGIRLLAAPWIARLALAVAPRLAPLPLEPYLRQHFTKVAPQTEAFFAGLIRDGQQAALPVAALQALAEPRALLAAG